MPQPTRIACIGGSITFGLGLPDRRKQCYPALLGGLLGDTHHVRNFGFSGAAVGRATTGPYWNTSSFTAATRFDAQVAIIALGTNDAQHANLANLPNFHAELTALAEHFRKLPSADEVVLVLPPPVFEPLPAFDIGVLDNAIRPAVQEVGSLLGHPLVDAYTLLADRPDLFPDNLHPNAAGAQLLAEAVYEVVKDSV